MWLLYESNVALDLLWLSIHFDNHQTRNGRWHFGKIEQNVTNHQFYFRFRDRREIPFLDLLIHRNKGLIEFDIYRKPQQVQRYIPSSSNHPDTHKKAAFDSMVYRLLNIPLSDVRRTTEISYIKETARINGYNTSLVDELIAKQRKKLHLKNFTQLTPIINTTQKPFITPWGESRTAFVELPRIQYTSDQLEKVLRRQGINCYYTSQGSLRNMLSSSKDRLKPEEKSCIHEIDCKCCDLKYRGQTRRKSIERFKEHLNFYNSNKPDKSAMATVFVLASCKAHDVILMKMMNLKMLQKRNIAFTKKKGPARSWTKDLSICSRLL